MTENRTWVVMREKDGYGCALCGRAETLPELRGKTPLIELATPNRGDTHKVDVCDACLRQVMLPRCADPFDIVLSPLEGVK